MTYQTVLIALTAAAALIGAALLAVPSAGGEAGFCMDLKNCLGL